MPSEATQSKLYGKVLKQKVLDEKRGGVKFRRRQILPVIKLDESLIPGF
jgi:hypothetical protein